MHADRQEDLEEAWAILERVYGHPLSSKEPIFAIVAGNPPPRQPNALQTAIRELIQNPSWQKAHDIVASFDLCPLTPDSTCQLHVADGDGGPVGMNCAHVGVLE